MKASGILVAAVGIALASLGALEIVAWLGSQPFVLAQIASLHASPERGALVLVSGLYFVGVVRRREHLASAAALLLFGIAAARLIDASGAEGHDFGISLLGAAGYALLALAMLGLARGGGQRTAAITGAIAALPLIGAVFFLVVFIVDATTTTPTATPLQISPYVAGMLGAASLTVLLLAANRWRSGGHFSSRFLLFASMGSFASMAVTVWLAVVWSNYVSAMTDAERDLVAATNFIDTYAERAIEGPNLIVDNTAAAVQFVNGQPTLPAAAAVQITSAETLLPQTRGLGIADADGNMVFITIGRKANFNIADRPYFIAHSYGSPSYLGADLLLRSDNATRAFTYSRRLERPDGSFGGVVVIAMDGQHFDPIFARLGFDDSAVAALLKRDGGLLTASGKRRAGPPSWAAMPALAFLGNPANADADQITFGELDDAVPRLVASHINAEHGFVVVTSMTEADILARWRRTVVSTAVVLLLALGAGGALAWVCHRSILREETTQKRSQDLLSFQNAVLESAPSAIVAFDQVGRVTLFNRAAEELFGYPAAEIVGKANPERLFDPDELAARAAALRPGAPADISVVIGRRTATARTEREWTCVRADGSRVPVMIVVSPFADVRGRLEGFLAVITGISARLQAERDLRYSEARVRAVLDNVIDGIITINERGIIQSLNPAVERIFGYTADELLHQNVKILMGEPYHAAHDGYLHNYLSTGRAKIIGIGREVEGRRKDGDIFPLDLAVSQVDLDGRAMFIGVVRDLSESKRVERMKAEFVSTVSHELRTPLTAIRGSLSLVNSGVLGEIDESVKELTVVAEQSSERLVRLINDILDVEKIGSGQLTLTIRPVKVDEAVARAVTDTRAFAQQFSVSLAVAESAPDATVAADFDRLVQVFTNLISNAAKFSRENGVVTLAVVEGDGHVLISVADTGIGIPEEFKTRIFNKFAQADGSDSKAKGGTGLGLNITKSLVERMDGRIWFESEAGVGTTFFVEMPLLAARATPEAADGDRPRILHLEDDEAIRTIVAHQIGALAEVHGAASVVEGLALADRAPWDVAILDLGLADGNGLELVPRLHTADGLPTPVIVFSALDRPPPDLPPSVKRCLVKSRATDRELAEAVRALCPAATIPEETP